MNTQNEQEYKIGVIGINGRMGQMLAKSLANAQDASGEECGVLFVGGSSRSIGAKDEKCSNDERDSVGVKDSDGAAWNVMSVEDLFELADCVIDFTSPDSLEKALHLSKMNNCALVIGTTGLSAQQEQMIDDAAQSTCIVYAANMSVGVNVLLSVVEQVSAILGDEFDIEILERHHKHKVDSPSGTALALGKAAAKGRNVSFDGKAVQNMGDRSGARCDGDIGFAVMRGGNIVGEHEVTFLGENERIEINHIASDRMLFADGAVRAALWLKGKENGLYSMRDVLGL